MLTDEHGLHISQRNVTVSTCGIVPKMLELAEEHLQITLALSLHGSTQEKRKKLMPVANKYEPTREAAEKFKNKLEKSGINVTIRREMGSDIDGACGQLRKRYVETNGSKGEHHENIF